MRIVRVAQTNYEEAIESAALAVRNGGIVAYPTETFYGLAVRYDSEDALLRLYRLKKRPAEKVFPLIIGDLGQLSMLTDSLGDIEVRIIESYWPAPLTILFDAKAGLSSMVQSDGLVAVRLSSHPIARALAVSVGMPITATSANLSSQPPAQNVELVKEYFRDALDMILDGGTTAGGLASTIIKVKKNCIRILREGAFDIHSVAKKMGIELCH